MRTLFLRPPSFDAFDGGAEGRLAMDGDSRSVATAAVCGGIIPFTL
jgi:hypothetical protein